MEDIQNVRLRLLVFDNSYLFISADVDVYYDQTWQDDRLAWTDLTLQIMMTSPQSVHVSNTSGFISASTKPKTANLSSIYVFM